MTVTTDRIGIVISDIVNNQLITRRYCNYTRSEAVSEFKIYLKQLIKLGA